MFRARVTSAQRSLPFSRPNSRFLAYSTNRNAYMRCPKRPTEDELAVALSVPGPPGFLGFGAWVEHIAAPRPDSVSIIVEEILKIPASITARLFRFGAIYTCPIPPDIPETMLDKVSPEKKEEMAWRRQAALTSALSREPKHATPHRLLADEQVPHHSYIRVHLSPKRFPVFHEVDWTKRVVHQGENFLVLDKPPYLPVVPTVDNMLEHALAGAAIGSGRPDEELLVTTRLDHCTEGLVVLGRTPSFVSRYNEMTRGFGRGEKMYRKWYRALTAAAPQIGPLTHHVKLRCRRQGTPFYTLVLGDEDIKKHGTKALPCDLIICSVDKVRLSQVAAQRFGGLDEAYEVLIELVTGRTHQIRAQLAAIGSPLLGDDLYMPLSCATTRERLAMEDPTLEIVNNATGRRLLAEPDGPIGLQAFRLEFDDGALFEEQGAFAFQAGEAWWRTAGC